MAERELTEKWCAALTLRTTAHTMRCMEIDGQALRLLRERDGWTATAFAQALGISLTYLGDIEAGRRTLKRNPALISRAAQLLKVPRSMIERHAPREVVA